MKNISTLDYNYFQFTIYRDYGPLNYLFVVISLLIYVIIISANVVIILTVSLKKSLHQPMYIFICCLCFNSLFGSSGFFPRFLMDLLSDTHFISRVSCLIQLYVIFLYIACELFILGIMAYDRFVAICQPLHYHTTMTFQTVLCLILFAELCPALCLVMYVFSLSVVPLCGNKLNRFFCSAISSLSCEDVIVNNQSGRAITLAFVGIPLVLILYTYLRILIVCRRNSADFKGKAFQTCLPHIVSFVTFTLSLSCELLLNRLESMKLSPATSALLALEYLIIPPINNPLVYGMTLPQIRVVIFTFLKIGKVSTASKMSSSACKL